MAEKKCVAWDENGGFAKLKVFHKELAIGGDAARGVPPMSLEQRAKVTNCMSLILRWCYGKVWVDKYGVMAEELIKQGILDK